MKKATLKNKSFIMLLVIILMASICLTGCGGGDAESAEDAAVETEATEAEETEAVAEEATQEEKDAALADAQTYLNVMPASYNGLLLYLQEFDGHSEAAATYAVDNCDADWNEQAVKHVQYYLDAGQNLSREEMLGQLEYEGYTPEQAEYGVNGAGL